MINPIKVADVIKRFSIERFEITQKYETVDAMYGLEFRKLTNDDIEALKDGKYLYCNDGEYAQIIFYGNK